MVLDASCVIEECVMNFVSAACVKWQRMVSCDRGRRVSSVRVVACVKRPACKPQMLIKYRYISTENATPKYFENLWKWINCSWNTSPSHIISLKPYAAVSHLGGKIISRFHYKALATGQRLSNVRTYNVFMSPAFWRDTNWKGYFDALWHLAVRLRRRERRHWLATKLIRHITPVPRLASPCFAATCSRRT